MNEEKAQTILAEVIEGRARWGKQFTSPYIVDDVFDALLTVKEQGVREASSALAKSQQALGAAKAREAKRKQERDEEKELRLATQTELKAALNQLEKVTAELEDALELVEVQRKIINDRSV